jgi:predicted O-linked N-acetylglucosamine transferase (SPINDLY family)
LITHTAAQYEEMAVKLATNPGMLARIREKLAVNRTAAPLFNTVKFARNLETAYISIMDRHHAGLAPDDIHVSP